LTGCGGRQQQFQQLVRRWWFQFEFLPERNQSYARALFC
jgi:hypothetical protein